MGLGIETNNEQNMSTFNYISGNTMTQNIFGQNYTNDIPSASKLENFNSNNYSNNNNNNNNYNKNTNNKNSKLNDFSAVNNYNNYIPVQDKDKEKDKDVSFRELPERNKARVNSRLESLKEQYEIYNSNKFPKDELELSTSFLKEKLNYNKKHNNNNNSGLQHSLNINNNNSSTNIINSSNINHNKISIITPASNRDCGVFDSNFVIKTDKRSFLLNENTLNKRRTSEDKYKLKKYYSTLGNK